MKQRGKIELRLALELEAQRLLYRKFKRQGGWFWAWRFLQAPGGW
jgi:hypothetical protein